jgi:uncharacterized protein YdaU (DUF1376 family)
MPLYIPDYLADTSHLSAEEHGAYLLLIMAYWMQNGLPDDDERLARVAKIPSERWPAVRAVIRPFFGEGWYHARVEEERAKAEKTYMDRSEAGRKGGKARSSKQSFKQNDDFASSKTEAGLEANDVAKSKPGTSNHNHNHHTSPFQERGDESPTRTHARTREGDQTNGYADAKKNAGA